MHDPSGTETPRGWGGGLIGRNIRGEIWIFSGTTQYPWCYTGVSLVCLLEYQHWRNDVVVFHL